MSPSRWEALLIRFAEEEDRRLAAQMPPRQITVAEDETFHPDICLVAWSRSRVSPARTVRAATRCRHWNQCLQEKLQPLPVTVRQVVSDEAKALVRQPKSCWAPITRRLFHVQHDVTQAMSLALAGQTERAAAAVTQAEAQTADLQRQVQACREQCPESSSVQVLEQQHRQAQAAEAAAREQSAGLPTTAAAGPRGPSEGSARTTTRSTSRPERRWTRTRWPQRLAGHFDQLDQIAAEAGLSARPTQKLAKARRVLKAMQATVKFYWTLLEVWISSWNLSRPSPSGYARICFRAGIWHAPRKRQARRANATGCGTIREDLAPGSLADRRVGHVKS